MRFVIEQKQALKMLNILSISPEFILGTHNDNVISIQFDVHGFFYRYAKFTDSFFKNLECNNNSCDFFKVDCTKLRKIIRILRDEDLHFEYPDSKSGLGISTSLDEIHFQTEKLDDIEKKKNLFFNIVDGIPTLNSNTRKIKLDSSVLVRKKDIVRKFRIVDTGENIRFTFVGLTLKDNEFIMRLLGRWNYDLDIEFKPKCIIKNYIEPVESWYELSDFKKVIKSMDNNFKIQFTADSPLWISNNYEQYKVGVMIFPYMWEE